MLRTLEPRERVPTLRRVEPTSSEPNQVRKPRSPRRNLYFESRYRKLRRGLPQTIFWCPTCKGDRKRREGCVPCEGFGKLTKESVQELIGRRMLPAFGARTGRFHGAGREDIDVLMLGSGRPFVFEVIGARNPQVDLDALRKDIEQRSDGQIELAPFVAVRKDRVAYWKQTNFEKIYRAEVALSAEPMSLDAAAAFAGKTLQRTPQRVAHRRADLDREREVKVLSATRIGDLRLELRLQCQHGTYVMEFISGDEGRTTPSLASLLGVDARCDVLDVEEILTPKSSFADGV